MYSKEALYENTFLKNHRPDISTFVLRISFDRLSEQKHG